MGSSRLHLHSMLVHSVVGLAALAAGSSVLAAAAVQVGRLGPELWTFLARGSLAVLLLVSLPAIVTGIADRDHAYATWHPSHRTKLALSLLTVAIVLGGLAAPSGPALVTATFGVLAAVIALAGYGLRLTLGRQALARTSYVPDMRRQPPIDILDTVAAVAAEEARLIDPSEEDAA